jgi:hypothetical protein
MVEQFRQGVLWSRALTVVVEQELMQNRHLSFHAGTNTATIVLSYRDVTLFLNTLGYQPAELQK